MIRKKIKQTKESKKQEKELRKVKPFKVLLVGGRAESSEREARQLYEKSNFGEITEDKVHYSLVEALYLLEKKKIKIYERKKLVKIDSFLTKVGELEPNFHTRYTVFRDMRNRGYIVKTALKFGADFRVYDKGVKPGEDHAKWILYPVYEGSTLTWHEFAAKNRVAHSTRKRLLIGIVDDEGSVTFYEIAWKRP